MTLSYNVTLINKLISDYQNGKKADSIKSLNKFVEKNPDDNLARYNLALMLSEVGKKNIAINHYKIIIDRDSSNWKAKFNLYLMLIDKKKFTESLSLIDQVLKIKNNYQPALRDKALVLTNLKKPDEGLKYIIESLKLNPNDYIALNTLGIIYIELKKYDHAEKIFQKAIEVNENYVSSYNNLGRCFSLKNKKEIAFKYFKKTLEMDRNYLDAINNIANYYSETGYYKKSLNYYFRALNLDKNNSEILFNIAVAYTYLKEHKNAEKYFKNSLKIDPTNHLLQKNISILYLNLHRFKEAWTYFDGRIGVDDFRNKNHYFHNIKEKLWQGEKLSSKNNILVLKEQGIGDEILYGSMYNDLLKFFPDVIIETEPRLITLFTRSFNKKNFIPYGNISKNVTQLKNFDTVIYAGSLGRLFRNNIKSFPKKNFLIANKNKIQNIKKKLDKIDDRKKIGISWISKNETYGSAKSLGLESLTPILEINKYTFINLQYGETQNEIKKYQKNTNNKIINIDKIDLFNDFESIAGLLKNLDLFISVSNSTAHLAGALGVPTLLIKPQEHAVFHYWNQPGNTTPWYNSIKLFTYRKNWDETIKDLKKELITFFR